MEIIKQKYIYIVFDDFDFNNVYGITQDVGGCNENKSGCIEIRQSGEV